MGGGKESCHPSGVFAAEKVREAHGENENKVLIIGGVGLQNAFKNVGFDVVTVESLLLKTSHGNSISNGSFFGEKEFKELTSAIRDVDIDSYAGVVVGWDLEFGLKHVSAAVAVLRHPNTFFYASNDDPYDILPPERLPGTGAQLSAIETVIKGLPNRVNKRGPYGEKALSLGKPNPEFLLEGVLKKHGWEPEKTLMVGDRLDTDIWMGNLAKVATLFVSKTGVHQESHLLEEEYTHIKPTFQLNSLADLRGFQTETTVQKSRL